MLPDLERLIALQRIETERASVARIVHDVPQRQAALDERAAGGRAAFEEAKARHAAVATAKRDAEKEMASAESRLSKFRDQQQNVKTNKEYQAMQKEMSAAEHDVRTHEDRLLEHMERAETLAADLKAAESALKTEQAVTARDQTTLEAERAEIEQELARLTAARSEVVATLSRDVLALFERVAHGRKGIAVAEARDGLCTVCHVRLRPQAFNEVKRNDGLHQCDSCTRILYYIPVAAPGGAAQPS